jgi:hypothetical protein
MIWQDYALTVINFGFIITLIPALIKNYQEKEVGSQSFLTYFSTSILLVVMAYVFLTLRLDMSCISTAGTGVMWFLLTYQKIIYSREKKS